MLQGMWARLSKWESEPERCVFMHEQLSIRAEALSRQAKHIRSRRLGFLAYLGRWMSNPF